MKKNFFLFYQELFNFILKIQNYVHKFSFEIYLFFAGMISTFLKDYDRIEYALGCFAIVTTLDTVTKINAVAKSKKLKFNPFKKYFWLEIKSGGFRDMANKIFMEYGVYLIIAFVIDILVFSETTTFNVVGSQLKLPVIAVYYFSFIEAWSIGENIEEAGGVNWLKRIVHFLPEKIQKIVQPKTEEKND